MNFLLNNYMMSLSLLAGMTVTSDSQSFYGPCRVKTCLLGFPKKRDSNQSPQLQIPDRILKFRLKQV